MRYLLLLLSFLFPLATGDADPDPNAGNDDAGSGDEGAGDDDAGDAGDGGDDSGDDDAAAGDDDAGSVSKKPAAQSDEAKEAVRLAREAQEAVRALTAPRRTDPTWEAEEARLKAADITPLEKWQIESNRTIRQNAAQSQQAMFAAHDLADKTAYQTQAISNPVYKKYAARVEEQLAKARSTGNNPPREAVLKFILGEDMLAGNFKSAAKKAAGSQTPRGKTPGARSDTSARGGQSEREKRRARLENVLI